MKRTNGRFGIGLVLVSTIAGACFTERESTDTSAAPSSDPRVTPSNPAEAREVVLAVRSHLERSFGKTNLAFPNQAAGNQVLSDFEHVLSAVKQNAEILGTPGLGQAGAVKAELELPALADGRFRLRDKHSDVSIDVGLIGATNSAREEANGYVVYRGGYLNSGHIIHRQNEQGTEDYVYFQDKLPAEPELRYKVALSDQVAGLRLVGGTLEMLDKGGAPRLRMAPPYALDGNGQQLAMNVAIEGCAYDTSTAMPWDHAPTDPGARECTVRLTWPADAQAPLLVDPSWTLTSNMTTVRANATSAVVPVSIPKYRVIVVGGDGGTFQSAVDTTEIFDETTNTWAQGPTLKGGKRTEHMMITMTGNNPGLLVIGGRNNAGEVLASAERLPFTVAQVPMGLQWSSISDYLKTPRARATAFTFDPGGKIVVAGGFSGGMAPTKAIDICDTSACTANPNTMTFIRAGHAFAQVTPPPAGFLFKVYMIGGITEAGAISNTIERCDLANTPNAAIQCSTSAPNGMAYTAMQFPRVNHVAFYSNQIVHVIGGDGHNTAECFNPNSNAWGTLPSKMANARSYFTATQLPDGFPSVGGQYLIVGGDSSPMMGQAGTPTKTTEIYDPVNETFTPFSNLTNARARHTTVILPHGGQPLVIGGTGNGVGGSAEYLPCTSDDSCAPGTYCSNQGICVPTKKTGEACNVKTDCVGGECIDATHLCEKGFCADGVCCDQACDGQCEACNGEGLGVQKPGKCAPVAGKPIVGTDMNRDLCETTTPSCAGTCNGSYTAECTYPKGNECDSNCDLETDTFQTMSCDGHGFCNDLHAEPCSPYKCDMTTNQCGTECTPAKDGVPQVGCDDKNAVCNVDGQCVANPTSCIDDENMKLADGTPQSCGKYRCVGSACLTVCDTAYDCAKDPTDPKGILTYVCDEERRCVPASSGTTPTEDLGCSTSPANPSSRFGWLAALAIAGAFATRRNRARA